MVRKNLNALHKARQEFTKSESDYRYKQALRRNVNTTDINRLKDGDEVYYKRNERDEWHGPGKVIDIDGKTVIVKHGGACVKVHEVSLKKKPLEGGTDSINPKVSNTDDCAIADSSQGLEETSGASPSVKNKSNEPRVWEETGGASSSVKNCNDSSVCNSDEYSIASGGKGPRVRGSVGGAVKACSQLESAMVDRDLGFKETGGAGSSVKNKMYNSKSCHDFKRSTMASGGQGPRVRGSVEKTHSQFKSTTVGKLKIMEETGGAGSSVKKHMTGRSQGKNESTNAFRMIDEAEVTLKPDVSGSNEVACKGRRKHGQTNSANKSRVWKNGDRFQGIDSVTGEYISGKIMYRAGKVTGANRDFYNIERDSDGWQGCINMNRIRDLSVVPDETEMIILLNNNEVYLAKEREIQNWLDNDVFEEVPDNNQKAITVRWVVTEKVKQGKRITKARLVARGFEEDTSNLRKESPTCSREAIRILILIASSKKWECHTVDVQAAYLQGNTIERKIYLRPPSEFNSGYLWRLKKTVYSLCDAARAWYLRVKDELSSLSVKMCDLDNSLFLWHKNGTLEGIVCIYVDDFLWSGTIQFEEQVIKKLKRKFLIGSSASIAFTYVGLSIKSYGDGITIDQTQYIESLSLIHISKLRSSQKKSELMESEKVAYRALVGQLNWIATHTRPDIAFDTCELSVSFKNATIADLLRLNKLVTRVKSIGINLFFLRL